MALRNNIESVKGSLMRVFGGDVEGTVVEMLLHLKIVRKWR